MLIKYKENIPNGFDLSVNLCVICVSKFNDKHFLIIKFVNAFLQALSVTLQLTLKALITHML